MRRYDTEASARWAGFEHRDGDIVISTRSKAGTTWVQMICALLVFQEPELPAPLAEISPWLDWDLQPEAAVRARLAAQEHRRVIKTHTPLDGLALDPRVTYVVVGRHPLDAAVSFYHHVRNIDRDKVAAIRGRPAARPLVDEPVDPWVRRWVDDTTPIEEELESLAGFVHHVVDAQARVGGEIDVVVLHYDDLQDDLDGEMRRLADHLGITVPEPVWPSLVEAAGFAAMAERAPALAPDGVGIFRSPHAFFRTGRSGDGGKVLTPETIARYRSRLATLAPPDTATWLDRSP